MKYKAHVLDRAAHAVSLIVLSSSMSKEYYLGKELLGKLFRERRRGLHLKLMILFLPFKINDNGVDWRM